MIDREWKVGLPQRQALVIGSPFQDRSGCAASAFASAPDAGSANVRKRVGLASLVVDPFCTCFPACGGLGLLEWPPAQSHRADRAKPFLTWRPGFSSFRKGWRAHPGGKPNHRWARSMLGKSPFAVYRQCAWLDAIPL